MFFACEIYQYKHVTKSTDTVLLRRLASQNDVMIPFRAWFYKSFVLCL